VEEKTKVRSLLNTKKVVCGLRGYEHSPAQQALRAWRDLRLKSVLETGNQSVPKSFADLEDLRTLAFLQSFYLPSKRSTDVRPLYNVKTASVKQTAFHRVQLRTRTPLRPNVFNDTVAFNVEPGWLLERSCIES
jgi:hypothetical protein